jgi:predicted SAM-dependent methyltransferase
MSFDYAFAEHILEHLTYDLGLRMLRECYRILSPGARIRLSTPDLARVISLHGAETADDIRAKYLRWSKETFLPPTTPLRSSFVINLLFHGWGHRFLYDEQTLASALETVGFRAIKRYAFGISDDPELKGVDSHGATEADKVLIAFESLILEATRAS